MIAVVDTASGRYVVDLETDEIAPREHDAKTVPPPALNLPRLVAAAAVGSTVVAVVDAKPPLLVSYDSGTTWRESGRGLPAGRAVAIAETDPDLIVYATRNRLFLSRNGGVFWTSLAVELPEIRALSVQP